MEIEQQVQGASWRWPLLLSAVFINICLPSLVLSYGVLFVHSVDLGLPTWLGLLTPTIFILTYNLTQCWYRDAADSWGGPVGYRVMASVGVVLKVVSLLLCAFLPYHLQPYAFGILGGLGASLVSAQVEAVIFDTYDSRLEIIRGICLSGQAIGQSLFPHILTVLIDIYGYSLTYVLLSGVMLQTLPTIMLLKVDDNVRKPVTFTRYSDLAKTYAIFKNDASDMFATELQLHDMSRKCWKSPSDDNLHRAEDFNMDDVDDDSMDAITPPPSPEEKRRNLFGVEILPEIPEESEDDSDEDSLQDSTSVININKKRLSAAIKRLSTLGDNFDEFIAKQLRRDSRTDSENKEYTEVDVTYDNISPITDIQREKIFNSFSFRCQSAYASVRRRMWMPSYKVYRLKRRLLYLMYNVNDTFIKPLTRSLTCWRFYPALILCFTRLSLTAVSLPLLPMIASRIQPKISTSETNFLMSLHGFTWICFLVTTPWLAQTPKRNFKYVVVFGLVISTTAYFVLADANNHDTFSIGCVVAGLGYGAITSCWETAVQDFVGARMWPKLQSTLEILSASLLVSFVTGLCFVIEQDGGLQYCMFVLGLATSVVTFIWLLLALHSIYTTKMRYIKLGKSCLSF